VLPQHRSILTAPRIEPPHFRQLLVRIVSSAPYPTDTADPPVRWVYRVSPIEMPPDPATGTDYDHPPLASGGVLDAYNCAETDNRPDGVAGNGVDLVNLPATFTLRPVRAGLVTPAWRIGPALWFCVPNAVDGSC
jgi:hypothetical protein